MKRLAIFFVVSILLSGCHYVVVPVPVPVVVAPTPTPDITSALGSQQVYETFLAKYDALDEPYNALYVQLDAIDFNDPEWRAETERLAQEWRAAIDDLRNMPQPDGKRWVEAWPVLMQALDEYAYAAGAVEAAATANDPVLMEPARERLINGVNLTHEAMRLLGGD